MSTESVWPYPIQWDSVREIDDVDVLVYGGGISGCWAAIGAATWGARVALVEKGATLRSGASGSGCDHWESAATNPGSGVTPEELVEAMISDNDGYNNGISHYIECREGWDRVVDLERMGAKIRDIDDEFVGAEFRDEKTKLLYAYDYKNRFTLRVWGTTFKKALYKRCRRLGVRIFDRTMAAGLLTEGGRLGARVVGGTAVSTRTGEVLVFKSKATVLAMSRPTRLWLFIPQLPGISEFRPPQCTGDGHAMAWRIGCEFSMLEKSVRAEWSGDRSYPPYGTGNNHNTWYACTMVDAEGRELPYLDRDGKVVTSVSARYYPSPGQRFFLKGGGESDFPSYDFRGPDTPPTGVLLEQGYKLPFYADLSGMPDHERRAIWGLMVGQEGKTRIPVLRAYTAAGFDPKKDMLQSYGDGWRSATFQPDERQFFGLPGGIMNDWNLRSNLEGLYAAGDQLFASNCHGHAAATGHYAGRHAAAYARTAPEPLLDSEQIGAERTRILAPLTRSSGVSWKELALEITQVMKQHCGAEKTEERLSKGLDRLVEIRGDLVARLSASNPHQLLRCLESLSVLSNAETVLHSCRARKASAKQLHFVRTDYPEMDPQEWHKWVTVRKTEQGVVYGEKDIDYYLPLKETYEANNQDYLEYQEREGYLRFLREEEPEMESRV
jgi:succinate dehydrogenase/fumarate reductase flavoprotein subunit